MRRFLAFHGTGREGYNGIRLSGHFKAGTYFARHLEDALTFGGAYVFTVAFDDDPAMWHPPDYQGDDWQFRVRQDYPVAEVVRIAHYEVGPIFHNEALGKAVFDANVAADAAAGLEKI